MKKKTNKRDRAPLIARLFDPRMWFYDLVKFTGIPLVLYTRLKRIYVTSTGKRPRGMLTGKYLVACNHVSLMDPVILINAFWERRLTFVAMRELFELRAGKFFKMLRCISIDRDNVSIDTFKQVEQQLYRGHVVGVFPEGGLETNDSLKSFKSGIALMAAMSKADIIPAYIVKRTSSKERQVVLIGDRIPLGDYITAEFPTMEELDNLTRALERKEQELEQAYQQIQANKKRKKH